MKKLINLSLFAIALLMSVSTFAQDNKAADGRQGRHGGHHRKEMMKQLNLSDDQKTKLRQMRTDMAARAKEIKGNSSLSEDQKKQQLKDLHQRSKSDLQTVLTNEQRNKLNELKQQAKDRRKESGRQQEGRRK